MLINNSSVLVAKLKDKKWGIIPTDTIYGFACLWNDYESIKKILQVKQRDWTKPFLILIASFEQLTLFIEVNKEIIDYINKLECPTTIIFPVKKTFQHSFWPRTVAIRFVRWKWLQEIILSTGPLVSTSCNTSEQPSCNHLDTLLQFLPVVDFICTKTTQSNQPSSIIGWKTKSKIR